MLPASEGLYEVEATSTVGVSGLETDKHWEKWRGFADDKLVVAVTVVRLQRTARAGSKPKLLGPATDMVTRRCPRTPCFLSAALFWALKHKLVIRRQPATGRRTLHLDCPRHVCFLATRGAQDGVPSILQKMTIRSYVTSQ